MVDCVDFKECDIQRRGLPACKGGCSIRIAMSDPKQWQWIKHFARDGHAACAQMVARGEGYYQDRDLPPRTIIHRTGKHVYSVPAPRS
jgi:hypothetical protein